MAPRAGGSPSGDEGSRNSRLRCSLMMAAKARAKKKS
jgi:hypothetical protein